ncbi:DUF4384 domain-containing protein [Sedimentitalea todarodis]|uniref:DUF4384 domain-containing protein n=1 Tax=Sedimentitalea todarodis TaxID=1631240 RepID=A0ABU3VIG9_9RHOB|nr:DUF4384 domain-containing protein [Sedimentitalea todarodis]MDU9005945.1 DUF4384 domain-containing protein [Sedimentitalea todarodis]
MTGGLGIWAVGICASALANAAIGTALLVAMRPEPVEQQQSPQSVLDVQAHQLNRDRAVEQQPEADAADAAEPNSPTVDAGHIPRSQAVARRPVPARLSEQPPPHVTLGSVRPSSATQTPAQPEPNRLGSAQTQGMMLPDRTVSARPAPVVRPVSSNALQSNVPDDISLPTVAAAATAIGTAKRTAMALPQASGNADPVTPISPPLQRAAPILSEPEKMTAALAYSGADDGEVDPASVAAFQSFVHPEDAPSQGTTVRDAVSDLLAQVPCSRLQVEFDPTTAMLRVNGHIPEDGLRTPVLKALQTQMGTDITLSDHILILPRPQCGALAGISNVGLPQSTDQLTNPLLVGADTHVRALNFVREERLYFNLTAPDYDAYIYVDYFDADGNVLHLSPNDQIAQRMVPAKSDVRVGARSPEDDGLQIFVGPPYGQEISAAFAASVPLYDTPRPLIEPAAAYLEWLKGKVATARQNNPDFKGEWVYFFVTTSAD